MRYASLPVRVPKVFDCGVHLKIWVLTRRSELGSTYASKGKENRCKKNEIRLSRVESNEVLCLCSGQNLSQHFRLVIVAFELPCMNMNERQWSAQRFLPIQFSAVMYHEVGSTVPHRTFMASVDQDIHQRFIVLINRT